MTSRAYWLVVAIFMFVLHLAHGHRYIVVRQGNVGERVSSRECNAVSMLRAMRERLRPESDSAGVGIYLGSVDPADEEALVAYATLGRICPGLAGRLANGEAALVERLARIGSAFIAEGRLEPGRHVLTRPAGGAGGRRSGRRVVGTPLRCCGA